MKRVQKALEKKTGGYLFAEGISQQPKRLKGCALELIITTNGLEWRIRFLSKGAPAYRGRCVEEVQSEKEYWSEKSGSELQSI